jgi:hypothetical protein
MESLGHFYACRHVSWWNIRKIIQEFLLKLSADHVTREDINVLGD